MAANPFTLWTNDAEWLQQQNLATLQNASSWPVSTAVLDKPRQDWLNQQASAMLRQVGGGALTLIPIAWGNPDKELAQTVRSSMDKANPATVIPWAPGQGGLRRRLRSMHVHTDIDDQPISHVHKFIPAEELTK